MGAPAEVLAENNRLDQLDKISDVFDDIMAAVRGEVKATITTAEVTNSGCLLRASCCACGSVHSPSAGSWTGLTTNTRAVLAAHRGAAVGGREEGAQCASAIFSDAKCHGGCPPLQS